MNFRRLEWIFILSVTPLVSVAQFKTKLMRVDPGRGDPPRLLVTFSPDPTPDRAALVQRGSWEIWVSDTASGPLTQVGIDPSQNSISIPEVQILQILLAPLGFDSSQMNTKFWTVQFNPPGAPSIILKSTRTQGTKCDGKTLGKKPFFCPPSSGAPADVSFSGNFLAGGGTKPIYTFELIGGMYAQPLDWLWKFEPGVSSTIEINQNEKPPSNKTTFDPNSIVAGFALQKMVPYHSGKSEKLAGFEFDESLPAGEFSRSDPTSNLIFSSTVELLFAPIRKGPNHRAFGTFFPMFGIETGKNLNKPQTIEKQSVDLSHYNALLRGYTGADVAFGILSPDKTANDLTVSGSYRVRLPAMDEPFVETIHQVTGVSLTTKARNWFEGDINYAPWSFKYLTLNAKYQYGELPPLFTLVDHKFTLGITFKAVQSNKPNVIAKP